MMILWQIRFSCSNVSYKKKRFPKANNQSAFWCRSVLPGNAYVPFYFDRCWPPISQVQTPKRFEQFHTGCFEIRSIWSPRPFPRRLTWSSDIFKGGVDRGIYLIESIFCKVLSIWVSQQTKDAQWRQPLSGTVSYKTQNHEISWLTLTFPTECKVSKWCQLLVEGFFHHIVTTIF